MSKIGRKIVNGLESLASDLKQGKPLRSRKVVGVSLSGEVLAAVERIAKEQDVSPSAWCYEVIRRAATSKRPPVAKDRPNGLAGADEATKEEVSRAGVRSREKKFQKSSSSVLTNG